MRNCKNVVGRCTCAMSATDSGRRASSVIVLAAGTAIRPAICVLSTTETGSSSDSLALRDVETQLRTTYPGAPTPPKIGCPGTVHQVLSEPRGELI
jgi:hypothetical protein